MTKGVPLTDRFEQAWCEWNDAIAGFDNADFELPVYRQWDLKDIMGHVLSYLNLSLRHIQSYKKRKRLASPRAPSYSYFNRREAARLKRVPLAQLRADLNATYRELVAVVPTPTDEDLRKVFPAQWWDSTYRTTLRGLLRETSEHMRIHAADVSKWRKRS